MYNHIKVLYYWNVHVIILRYTWRILACLCVQTLTLHCTDSYVLLFTYRTYTYVYTFPTLSWRYRWFDKWMFEPSALPWRSSQTSFRLKVNFESAILLRLTRRGWRGLSADVVITGLAGRIPKCIVNGWFSFFGWRGKTVTRNISRSVCLNK